MPFSTLYSSTQAAVDSVTDSLAKELGRRNIRVNTVAPGHTDTEGLRVLGVVDSEIGEQAVAATPLGSRFGLPDEIASDASSWLTGERISASGGAR